MDRVKIKISNFEAIDHFDLWDNLRPSQYPNRYIVSRKIVNDKANVKRPYRLKLMLYYDAVKDTFSMVFNGSIKKWYFGENCRRNLNRLQYLDCIKLLSAKIGIEEDDLWNATVTQLESGITLLLSSKFKKINNCLVNHRNFTRTEINTTLYFNGRRNKDGKESNYKLKMYEKNLEINKNNKDFYNDPIQMNVHKKFAFHRFEIVVKKVSGVAFYKQKANTLKKIGENWKEINLELLRRFTSINFVDLISEGKIIDTSQLNKRDRKKYVQFTKIMQNGFLQELEKFNYYNTSTNRSSKQKRFYKDYEMFLDKKTDYQNEFLVVFKKKLALVV